MVGFGAPGGYSEAAPRKYLENVGCESCHGPGGGHLAAPLPARYNLQKTFKGKS